MVEQPYAVPTPGPQDPATDVPARKTPGADGPAAAGSSVEPTGHAEVDAVLDSLGVLDQLEATGHVAVFEQAHARLREVLAEAAAPGPTA